MIYNDTNLYAEEMSDSIAYREIYAVSVNRYIDNLRSEADKSRGGFITPQSLAADREHYRSEFYKMLGRPLTEYSADLPLPGASKEFIGRDDMGTIYRILIEVTEGFTFYGILFLPVHFDDTMKYPFVISQHGGGGTPELCSDFYTDTNYTHMTRRVQEKNAVVFAPQLLLWDKNNFSAEYNREDADNDLKQLGSSITALEIFCIMRSIDYFCAQSYIDADKIGMIGLSYGGFYTMVTAAADTRIKSAYSSCFLNDRLTYNRNDWVWFNAANTFLDAETAALIAPRRLYIEAGKKDMLFDYRSAINEYERLLPYYEAAQALDNLCFNVFDGDHMLDYGNKGLDFFFAGIDNNG
jgi:dienelactone hydrolase